MLLLMCTVHTIHSMSLFIKLIIITNSYLENKIDNSFLALQGLIKIQLVKQLTLVKF